MMQISWNMIRNKYIAGIYFGMLLDIASAYISALIGGNPAA